MLYDLLSSVNARLIMGEILSKDERRALVDRICSYRDLREFISVSAKTFVKALCTQQFSYRVPRNVLASFA
jgi:hypothetical protein